MFSVDRKSFQSLSALALFTFAFLGSEFFFDSRIGLLISAEGVVGAQAMILGASVVGFLAYAPISKLAGGRRALRAVEAVGAIAALVTIAAAESALAMQIAGCITFFLLGSLGAEAHWSMARAFEGSPSLAKGAGAAYAAGILLQFLSNQFVPAGMAGAAVLCVGVAALAMFAAAGERNDETAGQKSDGTTGEHAGGPVATESSGQITRQEQSIRASRAALTKKVRPEQADAGSSDQARRPNQTVRLEHTTGMQQPDQANRPSRANASALQQTASGSAKTTIRAVWLLALVVLLACMFSTLDNVVTLANAQGSISVETWPRLFLAASGLAAGVLFDIRERRYMGFIMFAVTVLSTISILAVEAGASPVIGLIVFYVSSGFFVTFFTTTFLQLAPRMRTPQLWAGMGRAANNLCAFTVSGVSMMLTQSGIAAVMIASLILFVLVSVAFVGAGLFRLPSTVGEREAIQAGLAAAAAPTLEEVQAEFISRSGLTPREEEVLRAVTADERPLKQVADDLGISLRMVQRHLTNIYSKTDTQT
ncbi:helix-turn-helix transcriptional regulator [uncultured Senegalimassilia sp.]|uniref:helix-turn-helix transcriptional regulator n=1 Tax=uncultured Senegalimassilia sp. TaxID=1714350 RepID=UPI0025E6BF98|nr:helix-turn-helix transcriptional regulator [uncultured Senegalimassilia sp.]